MAKFYNSWIPDASGSHCSMPQSDITVSVNHATTGLPEVYGNGMGAIDNQIKHDTSKIHGTMKKK